MPWYRIELQRTDTFYVEVEADDVEAAMDIAYNGAPDLCHYCTNANIELPDGSMTEATVDAGEWEEYSLQEIDKDGNEIEVE